MQQTGGGRRKFIKQAAAATAAGLSLPGANVLGANDRVRLGIIGAGARGQDLMKYALKVDGVEMVAAADVYSRRRDEAKALAPGLQSYSDHRALLDAKDVDAVIVATPLHCHARHFLDTIAAGKDLFCEKTMTWSLAEAEACREAAGQSNRVIAIGLQQQSWGPFHDAREWIQQGLLGKVTHVQSWMSRNTPRGQGQWLRQIPPDCTAENVGWDAFLNGRSKRPFNANQFVNWRLFWEFSGGNVTENFVHQIAFIISALDLPMPTAVYMSGGVFSEKDGREVPDTIAITADYPNDVLVTWESNFNNERFGIGERFLGTHGSIERLGGVTDMVTGRSPWSVRYYPEKANRPDGAPLEGQAPNADHVANFVDCVRTRKTPNASADLGYRSAAVGHMANLSYRHKQRVTPDDARRLEKLGKGGA